jgi:hypothetical protein
MIDHPGIGFIDLRSAIPLDGDIQTTVHINY